MTKTRKPTWLSVAPALLLGLTLSGHAIAQPDTRPAKPAKAGKADKMGKMGKMGKKHTMLLPSKLKTGIEEKLGKPLTDEQNTKIGVAMQARAAAVKAASEKFMAELSGITGIAVADLDAMGKNKKGIAGPKTGAGAAPAAPTAPATPATPPVAAP